MAITIEEPTPNYIRITIGGAELTPPSDYSIEFNDLDAEGQRPITTGKLKRKRIRSDVMRINLMYNLKDIPSITSILNMVKPETFTVSVYDLAGGEIATKEMYCGPKKMEYIKLASGVKIQGLSFSLIET